MEFHRQLVPVAGGIRLEQRKLFKGLHEYKYLHVLPTVAQKIKVSQVLPLRFEHL